MGIVFRQTALGTIITFMGAGIGFLTTFFIVTHYLTPDEVGLTRLLVEVATLIGGFALLSTQSSAVRYYPFFQRGNSGEDKGFFRLLVGITLVGFTPFALLFYLLREPIIQYFSQSNSGNSSLFGIHYWLVLPLMLFIMYQTILDVYCSLRQRVFIPRLLHDVLLRFLLALSYLSYPLFHLSQSSFLLTFVGCYAICTLLLFGYVLRLSPKAFSATVQLPNRSVRQDFIRYTLLTLLSALGSTVVARLDLFMVSAEMGLSYGGIYTVAFFIVAVIEMPSRSLLSMNIPQASLLMYDKDYAEANRFFLKVSHQQVLVGILIFLLIWINIDTLMNIIPRSEVYSQGKWVVFWLGIGKIIDLSFNFGNAFLRYSKYYVWTLVYTILVMGITILTNLYLIEYMGIEGAAIATLITYVLSYTFQQSILWVKMSITPLDREMLYMYAVLIVVLAINELLPHSTSLVKDSIWQTIFLMSLTYLLLRKQPTFRYLQSHVLAALKIKR